MLKALSPRVAVALTRAQEARERTGVVCAEDRRFWREMERRWMKLAQSYEIAERLDVFIAELRKKALN